MLKKGPLTDKEKQEKAKSQDADVQRLKKAHWNSVLKPGLLLLIVIIFRAADSLTNKPGH